MKVMVVGDAILDEVVFLREVGRSTEGMPSYAQEQRLLLAGGSGNVAKHLARLGAKVCLVHVSQPLSFRDDGLTVNEALNIQQSYGSTPITVKTRFYTGTTKLFKVNIVTGSSKEDWCPRFADDLDSFRPDVVIACDNAAGMFDKRSRDFVSYRCAGAKKPLYVDAQQSLTPADFVSWNAQSIFLNKDERWAIGEGVSRFPTYHVKQGAIGSTYYDGKEPRHQYGLSVGVVDTLGAGDAYLAAWTVFQDLRVANYWAGLSCKRIATLLPERSELDEALAA